MKKISLILIIISMAFALTACTQISNTEQSETSSEATAAPEPTPEVSEESEDSSSDEEDNNYSHSESSLPDVDGSVQFVSIFSNNVIDATYIETLNTVSTVTEMVNTASTATASWEREISYAYNVLMGLLDDEAKDDAELEQAAWYNDLPIITSEIQSLYSDDASMNKFYIAYETMLVYRDRAAVLYYDIYEITGTIELAPDESIVVG